MATSVFSRPDLISQLQRSSSRSGGPIGLGQARLPTSSPIGVGQAGGVVLGTNDANTGTGVGSTGAGGGGGATSQTAAGITPQSDLLQAVPEAPAFDDSGFNAALSALGEAQGAAESGLSASRQAIEAARTRQLGELQAAQERQLGQFGQQRTREQVRGESAIAEARRQAAELQQGLQARFGASTGTGGFAGEILGREALRNISGNRQQLNQTLSQIAQEEEFTRQETERQIRNVNEQSEAALQNAQAQFQQTLADISGRRAETESARSNARRIALQDFANLRADIEARNLSFQRDIAAQQEARQNQLRNFADRTLEDFQAQFAGFEAPQFNIGGQQIGLVPTIGSRGQVTGVRTISGPDSEAEDDDAIARVRAGLGIQ